MVRPFYTVEMMLGGSWVDVTSDVLLRDPITITRGRADESARVSPSTCTLTLRNVAGKYSPRNPVSPYYGMLGRNTPIRVGVDRVVDSFDGRTVVDGWGTTSDGEATWALSGTASFYDVAAGVGTIVAPAGNRAATLGSYGDVEILTKMAVSALDANLEFGVVTQYADLTNCYQIYVDLLAGDTLQVRRLVDGTNNVVASETITSVVAGTFYWLRVKTTGRAIRARIWQDGTTEPQAWLVNVYDSGSGGVGLPARHGQVGCFVGSGTTATLSVDSFQVDSWRFHGETPSLQPDWDLSERDTSIRVTAAGYMRRWDRAQEPAQSSFRGQALDDANAAVTTGYWPCEDDADAEQAASGLAGGRPMQVLGESNFAADGTSFPGSAPLIRMAADTALHAGLIPTYTHTGSLAFRGLFAFPSGGLTDNTHLVHLWQRAQGIQRWQLMYRTSGSGSLDLVAIAPGGAFLDTASVAMGVNGKAMMLGFTLIQDGSDVDWHVFGRHVVGNDVVQGGLDGTFTGLTLDIATRLYVVPNRGAADLTVGHLLTGNSITLADNIDEGMTGYRFETAADRVARLAAEGGITCSIIGDADESTQCGTQRITSRSELIRDAVDADAGILLEPRDELGIAVRTRASMDNQTAAVTLSYPDGEIAGTLQPTTDDQRIANDVTASRFGGSSYRAEITTGPLNVNEPEDDPDGVGRYQQSVTAHVATDLQLPDVAHWVTRQGTVDEDRFPVIGVNHTRLRNDGKSSLSAAVASLDIGDRFLATDPPSLIPTDAIDQIAQGYTETLLPYLWTQILNASPASPHAVAEVWAEDATHGYDQRVAGGDDMVLAQAVDDNDTSLLVTSLSGAQRWATPTDDAESVDDFPMDVFVGGERLTVSDVDPGFSDTFTRSTSNGWGTPTASYPNTAYTVEVSASVYSTTGTVGRINTSAVNTLYMAHADCGCTDGEVYVTATVPVVPTGAPITVRLAGRVSDSSNYYWAEISIATSGAVTLQIFRRIGGTPAALDSGGGPVTLSATHAAGNSWTIGLRFFGTALSAKAWKTTDTEPVRWRTSGTDDGLTAGTRIAALVRRETGNTNGAQNIDFDDFTALSPQILTVTRSVNGIAKAHAAGDVVEVAEPAYVAR